MNILIVCAHPKELQVVKNAIKKRKLTHSCFSFFCSGVGCDAMMTGLASCLSTHVNIDLVVNFGVVGYCGSFSSPYLHVHRIQHLQSRKEIVSPPFLSFLPSVSSYCSLGVVNDMSQLSSSVCSDESYIVDMESWAVAYVCQKFSIPYVFCKSLADRIGDETKYFDYQYALSVLDEFPYDTFLESLETIRPLFDTKTIHYDFLRSCYHFTYAEWLMMVENIAAYNVLSGGSFSDRYYSQSFLSKDDFLTTFNRTLLVLRSVE